MAGGSDERADAIEAFRDAAIEWAATGYGQPLVDAAGALIVADPAIESEALVMLAGAPARLADEEAHAYAAAASSDVGVDLADPQSPEAYRAFGRLLARRFLAGAGSERDLARKVRRLWIDSDYSGPLGDLGHLHERVLLADDGYEMMEPVERAIRSAAERLAAGDPPPPPPRRSW